MTNKTAPHAKGRKSYLSDWLDSTDIVGEND